MNVNSAKRAVLTTSNCASGRTYPFVLTGQTVIQTLKARGCVIEIGSKGSHLSACHPS